MTMRAQIQINPDFDYEFEELPLVIGGVVAHSYLFGSANIEVFQDGEWNLCEVSLVAAKSGDNPIHLNWKEHAPLLTMIEDALRLTCKNSIEDKIEEMFEEQRELAS